MKKYLLLSSLIVATSVTAQELVIEEIPMEQPLPIEAPQSKELTTQTSHGDGTLDDLYTLVEEQKKALRDLTERLEQAEFRLKTTEEKLERTNNDIVFRLTELENKPTEAPVIIDKNSDKDRYEYAYALLQKADYKNAQDQLLSFIKDFDKSDLKPNAIYWLGETYYVQQQFEKAVGQFADVFTNYPKSNKAPDALLKMGLSMVSLKKIPEACTAFIALPNEYPKASEELKTRANEEAQKNKCS